MGQPREEVGEARGRRVRAGQACGCRTVGDGVPAEGQGLRVQSRVCTLDTLTDNLYLSAPAATAECLSLGA